MLTYLTLQVFIIGFFIVSMFSVVGSVWTIIVAGKFVNFIYYFP